jgi:hypothetical protein
MAREWVGGCSSGSSSGRLGWVCWGRFLEGFDNGFFVLEFLSSACCWLLDRIFGSGEGFALASLPAVTAAMGSSTDSVVVGVESGGCAGGSFLRGSEMGVWVIVVSSEANSGRGVLAR